MVDIELMTEDDLIWNETLKVKYLESTEAIFGSWNNEEWK